MAPVGRTRSSPDAIARQAAAAAAERARIAAEAARRRAEEARRAAEAARQAALEAQRQEEQARLALEEAQREEASAQIIEQREQALAEAQEAAQLANQEAMLAAQEAQTKSAEAQFSMAAANNAAVAEEIEPPFTPADIAAQGVSTFDTVPAVNPGEVGADPAAGPTPEQTFLALQADPATQAALEDMGVTTPEEFTTLSEGLSYQLVGAAPDAESQPPLSDLAELPATEAEAILSGAAAIAPSGTARAAITTKLIETIEEDVSDTLADINAMPAGDERDNARLALAARLPEAVALVAPDFREELLVGLNDDITSLASGISALGVEETAQFLASMGQTFNVAGEGGGAALVDALASTIAAGELDGTGVNAFDNAQQFIDGMNQTGTDMSAFRTAFAADLNARGGAENVRLAGLIESSGTIEDSLTASETEALAEAEADAARAESVAADVTAVEAAYDDAIADGQNADQAAEAAAAELLARGQAHEGDQDYLTALAEAAQPQIDRLAVVYGDDADADNDGEDGHDNGALRRSVGALADFAALAGPTVADDIARRIAAEIPDRGELEHFDDGFYEHADAGGDTLLFRAVYNELNFLGKTEAAQELENNNGGRDLGEFSFAEFEQRYECVKDDPEALAAMLERWLPVAVDDVTMRVREGRSDSLTPDALALLSTIAADGGPQVTDMIATQFAASLPDQEDLEQFDDVFESLSNDGKGFELGLAITQKLVDAGKTKSADALIVVLNEAVEAEAQALHDALDGAPLEDIDGILDDAGPSLDLMQRFLRESQDLAQGDSFMLESFNNVIGDLAYASRRAQDAGATEHVDAIASDIASSIAASGTHFYETALQAAVSSGQGGDLAIAVATRLQETGKTEEASAILYHVNIGMTEFEARFDDLAQTVEQHNAQLAQLMEDWGPLMSDEQLDAAVAAYRESHPEYEELGRMSRQMTDLTNAAASMSPELSLLPNGSEVLGSVDSMIENQFPRLNLTTAGQEEFAAILDGEESNSGLTARLSSLVSNAEESSDFAQSMALMTFSSTTSRATAAIAAGDFVEARRIVASLNSHADLMGLERGDLRKITDSLDGLIAGGTPEVIEGHARALNDAVDDLDGHGTFSAGSGVGQAVRGAGVLFGVFGTYQSFEAFKEAPDLESTLTLLNSAAGTTHGTIELVAGITNNLKLLNSTGLATAGSVIGVVGVGLSVVSAADALANGDPAKAGLYAAQAAGGIALIAGGAAATGVGAVVILGAAAAMWQLDRVRASNIFENDHTEAFLEGAGIENPDLTYHLRDGDDEGRSVAPVLVALADHVGVPGPAMLAYCESLDQDQLATFVEQMHGVDPNGDGEFPATATTDGDDRYPPRSLTGLGTWLEDHDYPPLPT